MRSVFAVVATLFLSGIVSAQERTATPGFTESEWLAANASFDIILSGTGRESVAVLLDRLDVSALFHRVTPERLRYRGSGPALPAGQHTLTVYDVEASGAWTAIGQFAIRLLSPRGFVSTKFDPAADLTGKGQFGELHSPEENAPERDTFQDGTTQLGLQTELVRPTMALRAEAQIAGVTYRNEALRFGILGERAPKLDLAGYRIDLQRGSNVLSVGHVGFGTMRHLINGFRSRGVSLTVGEGRPVSLQLAVMNGTSIVGWNNAVGLEDDKHRVWGATLGAEAFRNTPGKLRLEYGYFQGSARPLTGFNQGGVVTAETSRGHSLRATSSTAGGRIRFDTAYTTSQFESELDAEVEAGLDVTPIEKKSRSAWFAETSFELLRNHAIGSVNTGATLNVRVEDIEPLFRSLGTSVQPDLHSESADLVFNAGSVTGTVAHLRTHDNLASIESILTTRTDRSTVTLGLPVATMFGMTTGARWMPIVSVQADRLHQFGDGLPIGGDFTIESIPDFESRNLLVGADWQLASSVRAGVKVGATTQDNRQAGSEDRDTRTRTSALVVGWTPSNTVSIGGELGLDRNERTAEEVIDSTLRWAASLNWVLYKEIAFSGSITNIRAWDDLATRDSENIDAFVELSTGFRFSRADQRKGRIFVRWTDRQADFSQRTFGLRDSRRSASFATGLSLSIF